MLSELPTGVQLVTVAKGRTIDEIREAVIAGANIIGENYLQETLAVQPAIGGSVQWHFIGHLQKNKVKQAVNAFDMIETIDSFELASEIDKRCRQAGKILPVLIEINSGREPNKSGVMPQAALELVRQISALTDIKVQGLMTMGSITKVASEIQPYFKLTRQLYEEIRALKYPNVDMMVLSMGMSDSYRMAIEEGANMIHIGRGIFG
jgi:pyridoxal phosphate enzyme (YggS family)